MKVLLFGEYSGLHKNLKEGLQELGHDVLIAANGDGWKNIDRDIDLGAGGSTLLHKVISRIKPFFILDKLVDFDVVQIINPFVLGRNIYWDKYFFNFIKERNEKLFMLAAGDDAFFWSKGRCVLKYGPFDDSLKFDLNKKSHFMESTSSMDFNKYMANLVNGIIPVMYEYQKSYEGHIKQKKTIPLPINTSKIKYTENKIVSKLVVFHGLNRYGFKGTRHVEEAFRILSKKYPNDLELIIDGKMSLVRYLDIMKKSNVVIDQVYSHSCGMNALYAMALGKVVLGGAEPESLISLGVTNSPVINVSPDAQSIVTEIEALLEIRSAITEIGYSSRQFVEKVHGHVVVAKKYLDCWMKFDER